MKKVWVDGEYIRPGELFKASRCRVLVEENMKDKRAEIADQIALFIDVLADPGKHPTRRRLIGTEVVELVSGGKKYSITVKEKR